MTDDNKPRPVETLRNGALKASIWRNEGEHGAYHQVTLSRTYKDKDGNLQDTTSFREKDLLAVAELARVGFHTINDLERSAFKAQRRDQAKGPKQGQSHSQ